DRNVTGVQTCALPIFISIIGMLIMSMLFFSMGHLVTILIFGALFYFFSSPVGAFGDSLAQRRADELNISFGSIRMWGSIGFGLRSEERRVGKECSVSR